MQLIPCIEFSPSDGLGEDEPLPRVRDGSGQIDFWQARLVRAGVEPPPRYSAGYGLVRLEDIRDDFAALLLAQRLAGVDFAAPDYLDAVGVLCGGYVLESGSLVVPPQCCCDLGNLRDWQAAATQSGSEENMLWIGHPWLQVRAVDDQTLRCRWSEEAGTEQAFELDLPQLRSAIQQAATIVQAFYQQLRRLLSARPDLCPRPSEAAALAAILVFAQYP